MPTNIETSYIREYNESVLHLAQQEDNRLRGTVMETPMNSDREYFDRLGPLDFQERTGRRNDVEYSDADHTRRLVSTQPYFLAETVDRQDRVRMKIAPEGEYARAMANASNRRFDQTIIDRMLGDADESTGSAQTNSTQSFDTTNQQVAVDYVESGSSTNSNLTPAKVRRAREILGANEVPEDEMYAVVTMNQIMALLRHKEVTSSDYSALMPLMSGTVEGVFWMGFRWRRSERLPTNSSSHRRTLFYHRSALMLGVNRDYTIRVDELPGKHYMTQIYSDMDIGAVRMEEERVVDVLCDESK